MLAPDYALSADQTRGLTFAALIFGIVALILVDRSRSLSIFRAISRPNRALALVVPIVAAMLGLVMFRPRALDLFEFASLPRAFLAVPPLAGLAIFLTLEALKPLWHWAQRWSVRRHAAATPKSVSAKTI